MATTAQYASTPNLGAALLTTGDTSLTAPTTVATVVTAGASGSRFDNIDLKGVATTTASMLRLFLYDGTTYHLWKDVPVLAVTASSTVPPWEARISTQTNPDIMPLTLKSGWSLRATVNDTQTGIKVMARGGDF